MKKIRFSKVALTVMLLFLLVYTIYNTGMFYSVGIEPSTLTACVYAFCGGFMAWLKAIERKGKDDNND